MGLLAVRAVLSSSGGGARGGREGGKGIVSSEQQDGLIELAGMGSERQLSRSLAVSVAFRDRAVATE